MTPVRFGVLGVTEVDGRPAGAPRERAVLARLLVARGGVVTADQLLDDLWPDPLAKSAIGSLHATISRLRAALGEGCSIERRGDGYSLPLRGHALDLAELEDDVGAIRAAWLARELEAVVAIADRTTARFRGPVLEDIAETDVGRSEVVRVAELRAACEADRAAALVELGHGAALAAVDAALASSPYDERLWGLKMTAHYRAGRQADALATYELARRTLRDELGLTPAPSLQAIHAAVLAHDPDLDRPRAAERPVASPTSSPSARRVLPPVSYVNNGGVHLAFRTFGEGDLDIVWLPDFLFHLDVVWECPAYASFLDELAALGRLITFDKRGQGLSDRTSGPATVDERVSDLGAVLDAVSCRRAILVGSSEGVFVAAQRAAAGDPRVAGLVLIGSTPVGTPEDGAWVFSMDDYISWIDWAARHWGVGRTLTAMAPSVADDPDAVAWWGRLERQTVGPGGVRAYGRANAQGDYRDVLPFVRVPTLVLHRRDEGVPIAAARYIAAAIPDARLVELEGADHLVWFGDAEAALREIRTFVAEIA